MRKECGRCEHLHIHKIGGIPFAFECTAGQYARLNSPVRCSEFLSKPPKFLKRFNCIRCGNKLTKEEHEIDTGNLCEECRKVTINEDEHE